jgi:plasmid stabilization system protein ParE
MSNPTVNDSGPETFEVLITPKAMDMLSAHARFLANASERAAMTFVSDFQASAESLAQLPERCPWISYEGFREGKYRKLLFSKRYLAIFTVKGRKVHIHYVVDTRQDYAWLLER